MKFPVSPLVAAVPFPPISRVKGWVAGRLFPPERPLIDLCQAVPDYSPPSELTGYLASLLDDPRTSRYTPDEGLAEVREAICGRYLRLYGGLLRPEQICLTIGASQAFWLAMVTLCRAGDEVIVPLPYYFDHAMALEALGVRMVHPPFDAGSGGLPDPEAIAALMTEKTRAILLVTPSNPTGAITPPATLTRLLALARERGVALVLDETYHAFLPGGVRPHQLFCDPGWQDHLVHIVSFGKTYALTGYRAGMLAASEGFIHQALKVQDSMAVCQPRITQEAVRYGVTHLDEWVAGNGERMQRRHDHFCAEFVRESNPFSLVASGAFFAWVRHPSPGGGWEMARRLAEEAHLLVLPGEAFGPGLSPYLRLAFGNIDEKAIPEGVARFRNFSP